MCIVMSSLKSNEPSLKFWTLGCVQPERVREVIEGELELGEIERVDAPAPCEFEHADGVTRKMRCFYVHFKKWGDTKVDTDKRVALANGLTELRVVYDAKGHYWKCRGAEYKSESELKAEKETTASFEFVEKC